MGKPAPGAGPDGDRSCAQVVKIYISFREKVILMNHDRFDKKF